jgi:hypothetical protein
MKTLLTVRQLGLRLASSATVLSAILDCWRRQVRIVASHRTQQEQRKVSDAYAVAGGSCLDVGL